MRWLNDPYKNFTSCLTCSSFSLPCLLAGQTLPQHQLDILITDCNYACFLFFFFFSFPPTPGWDVKIPLHHAAGLVSHISSFVFKLARSPAFGVESMFCLKRRMTVFNKAEDCFFFNEVYSLGFGLLNGLELPVKSLARQGEDGVRLRHLTLYIVNNG